MVWTTKNRNAFLKRTVRPTVFKHILDNAQAKGIFVDSIGGGQEHVHLLISLGARQTIAEIAQLLKGEASFWINKEKLIQGMFKWQDEYYAASVGEDDLERVRQYIQNQDEHHRKKTFAEEYQKYVTARVAV